MTVRESRFGRLVDHFFTGFFDNDLLVSSQAGMQSLVAQIVGLLAAPGLFYCFLAMLKYGGRREAAREMLAWDDRLMFVHCAMILTGLLTIIEWDALFPDRRDYLILGPLPITSRLVFLAKLGSALGLLLISWAALNAAPSLMFPLAALTSSDSVLTFLRNAGGHILATLAASAFAFLSLIGMQGLLLNVLNPRWFRRASLHVQLLAVLVLVLLFLMTPPLVAQAGRWILSGNPMMRAIPSYWFLGLYQILIGRGSPVFTPLAGLAMSGLGIAAGLAALTYFASYRRHLSRSAESLEGRAPEAGWLARSGESALHLFVLRHPLERAYFHFIRKTLLRSRIHRLLLAACLGVGFALGIGLLAGFSRSAANGELAPGLLSVQLVLSFLLLSGMRFAFAVPAELRANWTFQAADPYSKRHCAEGARKAMLALGVLPVVLALAPLHTFVWGWQIAAAHMLYGITVSAILVEVLLLGFGNIPFTCTYLPGKSNLKALWLAYLLSFWGCVYFLAKLEAFLLITPAGFAAFCAFAVGVIATLRWHRRRQFSAGFRFRFEDLPEPAVRTLDISCGAASPAEAAADAAEDSHIGEVFTPARRPGSQQEPQLGEVLREWGVRFAGELRSDLRFGFRKLMHSPGFTFGAVAILAVAIGANTLLFTFFNSLVLRPLPIKDRHRNAQLTAVGVNMRQHYYWSYPDFSQLRSSNQTFEEMYAWASVEVPVREPSPRKLKADLVTGNFLRLFNARMILGRPFTPEEDAVPGGSAVVVLSHHAWRSLYAADPDVVGKTVRIRQTLFTILGVTDPAFNGADPLTIPDLWAPVTMRDQLVAGETRLTDPENAFLKVAGLLGRDVTVAQAKQAMLGRVVGLNPQHAPALAIQKITLTPLATYIPLTGDVLLAVVCLFSLFALLLLIACANLAGILLARGAARQGEIAVRASIGASRPRLIRQLLNESLLLCVIAAGPTLLLALAALGPIQRYLWALMIEKGFYVQPVVPDWHVFAYMTALVVATGILLGLVPALDATRGTLAGSLKEAGAGVSMGRRPRRVREFLVVAQIAASLILLVVAGILTRNAQRVYLADPGIDMDRVMDMRADGPTRELIRRLREHPGIEAVSETCRVPMSGAYAFLMSNTSGRLRPIFYNCVESQYFATVGLHVSRGRTFTAQEARSLSRVAVISEATAHMLWPGEDPLGKILEGSTPSGGDSSYAGRYEVVGVVPDVINSLLSRGKDYNFAYLPAAPGDPRNHGLLVRTRDASRATTADIRKLCLDAAGMNACEPATLADAARLQRFPYVAGSAVSSLVGGLALVMACVGLYGVVAFAVVQRTREIGIRMALGATSTRVMGSILAAPMRQVAVGCALGIPLCIGFTKVAAHRFATSAAVQMYDPAVYVAAPLYLAAVTLTAAYIPARRAAKIDPISALRQG